LLHMIITRPDAFSLHDFVLVGLNTVIVILVP